MNNNFPKLIVTNSSNNNDSLNDILTHLNLPLYNENFSESETIHWLSILIHKSEILKKKYFNIYSALNEQLNTINDLKDEEEELDLMEIKLARLKEKYSNLENEDLNFLRKKRIQMENVLNQVDYNLLVKVKEAPMAQEHRKYFAFLNDPVYYENYMFKEKIMNLEDSNRKLLIVYLIKYRTLSLNKMVSVIKIEKNELLKCVYDMMINGIVEFDNIDTIKLVKNN